MKYRCIKQYDSMDCAAACLASIAWYYGKKIPILEISEALETSKEGTSVWDVCRISEKLGLFASAYKKNIDFKEKELEVPCVAHVYQEDGLAHFIIIYKIKKNSVVIADPAVGIIEVDRKKFFNSEYGEDSPYFWTGVIILFQTTEEFYKKKEGMRIAENKFIELVKKEWKRTIYIILFSAISMAISIVSSFYFGTLIDTVIPNRLIYSLIFMTLMVILMLLIKTIVDWGRAKLSLDISKSFNLELSLKYYKHLLDLQVMSIEKRKNGEFISRFQDVIRVQEALVSSILVLPIDALFIIAVSIILCVLNIKIFAVVVVMCFLYTLVMVGFRKYYSVLNSEEMSREARVTSHLIDSIEGILTVKAYTYNKTIFNNGKKKIERWQDTILNLGSTENLQSAIKVLIGGMGEIIVLCIGALEIIGNNLSIGELVTYNILIGYLLTPVKDIVNLQPLYHSAHVAMERLESVLRIKVKKLVCMQIGDIYLKSCLCGVIISIVLQYCVLNNVVKNLYLGEYKANSQLKLFNLSAYIVVLVLVAITLFGATLLAVYKLTMITPIEAAKYEEVVGEQQSDYQFGKMFIIKRTGIIFGMAFRNILRYKKKFMFIIIFLAFGCEIGLLGIVVTKGTNQMNRLQKNPDFTIEVPMDTVTYLVENGKDEVELITDDNIVDIKNTLTSYTENLKIVQGFLPIIKNAAETDSLKIVEHDSLPVMQTLDDKSMKKLVKYVEENNIPVDQKTFNEKGGVLILHENLIPQTYEDIETECIGKIIELYDLVPVGTAMQEMSAVKLRNCGYINISQSDCPTLDLSWRGNDKVYLIVSDKTFSKLKDVLTVRNLEVQINVKANKEAICKQKLKAWVQEANLKFQSTTGNENQLLYVIKCNSDEIAKQSLYIRTSQIIMYTISGILIFMGLLNYFSTTSTNIIIRQREFSIMRSIGMTQGMLRKMLIYEGIIYVGGVLGLLLIIGSIVMGIVVYILKQNIEYFVFQYPFEGLLCIICIMSFLCVIIPNIFLHKMERNSLIERIKKER